MISSPLESGRARERGFERESVNAKNNSRRTLRPLRGRDEYLLKFLQTSVKKIIYREII